MGKTLILLMLLSAKLTFSQVVERFDDGDFTENPTWFGDAKWFNINVNRQLQSMLSANSQTISLATKNLLATNVKWEFDVRLNFDPSTTNQLKIYLMADEPDLKAGLNGYFLQIGEAGSADSFDLYRQEGTVVTKIIDGPSKIRQNANLLDAKFAITRDENGKWEVNSSIDGKNLYQLEGSIVDLKLINCDWFGINCKYTGTRSEGFYFDNLSITELVPDVSPPKLINVKVIDERKLEVTFSERLNPSSALIAKNYALSKVGNPATVTATTLPNVYQLEFANVFLSGNYDLVVHGLADLKGNVQSNGSSYSFVYVKPYRIKPNDILVSELLFNPKAGGADFVEIYNNTEEFLDLKNLKLANIDGNGNAANIKTITTVSTLVPPKTFWVLTTNPSFIGANYRVKYPNQMLQMASLPAFNNDKGTIILLADEQIDRFDYNEKMHSALLTDHEGITLERVSFLSPTNEPKNFVSAAMDVGFATPTCKNSATKIENTGNNQIFLTQKIFSPDADGFEDALQINYQFADAGNMANVNIYTDRGVLVRKLQRNISLSGAGNFIWDGYDDHGTICKVGIYLIKFDTFSLKGVKFSFKQTCVLAAKLN